MDDDIKYEEMFGPWDGTICCDFCRGGRTHYFHLANKKWICAKCQKRMKIQKDNDGHPFYRPIGVKGVTVKSHGFTINFRDAETAKKYGVKRK